MKDYAEKKRLLTATATKLPYLSTFIGVLVGASLMGFFFYWGFQHPPKSAAPGPTASRTAAKTQEKPKKRMQFDFYALLPQPTRPFTEEDTPATRSEKEGYLVQLASFRQYAQADALKARLAFSGIKASIQTFKINGTDTWYRVYLGPFPSKPQALLAQKEAEEQVTMHSLVLKTSI